MKRSEAYDNREYEFQSSNEILSYYYGINEHYFKEYLKLLWLDVSELDFTINIEEV